MYNESLRMRWLLLMTNSMYSNGRYRNALFSKAWMG